MKKFAPSTIATVLTTLVSTAALAAPTQQQINFPPSQLGGMGSSSGFAGLEAYLGALYTGNVDLLSTQNHQPIPGVNQMIETNTAQATLPTTGRTLSPHAAVKEITKTETTNNVTNTLRQFVYEANQGNQEVEPSNSLLGAFENGTTLKTANGKTPFQTYMADNTLAALTIGPNANASDSLFTLNKQYQSKSGYTSNKSLLEPPATPPSDNFLSFANLFDTSAYNQTNTENDAKRFILYAADSTKNFADGTGLATADLYKSPGSLAKLKNSEAYKKYVMLVRSLVALRSVNLDSLHELIAERTPQKGLSQAAGIPEQPAASPLQVEAYQADHRIDDPKWYKKIQEASPATVQRETLIVLAEIEHQNYQAHLDRERILAAVTAMNLQMSMSTTNTALQLAAMNLNKEVAKIAGTKSGGVSGGSQAEVAAQSQNTNATDVTNAKNANNPANKTNTTKTPTAKGNTTDTQNTTSATSTSGF